MTDNSDITENVKPVRSACPSQLRLMMLSLIILIAGIVIGSAGTTLLIQKKSGKLVGSIQGGAGRLTRGLRERLKLSDEQFGKIEPIIKLHMDKLRSIQDDARPLIESEISEMKENISAILSEEQNLSWERQMKFLERGFQDHRPNRRSGGPDGGQGGGPYGPGRGSGPGPGGGRGMGPYGPGRGPGPSGRGMRPAPGLDGETRGPGRNRQDGQFGSPDMPMRGERFPRVLGSPDNDHNSVE